MNNFTIFSYYNTVLLYFFSLKSSQTFFYFALQLAMPRASLGKLKNTIFSKQGLLLRLLQPHMTCQTRLEELKHTVDEPRHNIHSSVLAPLCAHNNILSFDRNSAKRQQQEPHIRMYVHYVCIGQQRIERANSRKK